MTLMPEFSGSIRERWPVKELFDIHLIEGISRAEGEERIRGLCESHYMGDHEIVARCLGRYKMYLDTRSVGFTPHILMEGYWEYWITQFVVSAVKPGMTAFDVGANFGYYTLLMSELVGPEGKCVAVEPNPLVAAKLRKTVSVNGFGDRTAVAEVAAGAAAGGHVTLCMPRNEPLNAYVLSAGAPCAASDKTMMVSNTALDVLSSGMDRVDFVKVDAEGAEDAIVDGMEETFRKFHPVLVIECNAKRNYNIRDFYNKLRSVYGNMCYVDYDGQPKPVSEDDIASRNVGQDWMLCCY